MHAFRTLENYRRAVLKASYRQCAGSFLVLSWQSQDFGKLFFRFREGANVLLKFAENRVADAISLSTVRLSDDH